MSTVADTATLVHGYTMGDVDRLARTAARRIRMTNLNFSERYEHAWFGVVELLYSTTEKPTEYSLVHAGMGTISAAFNENQRHHGKPRGGRPHSAPHFVAFWDTAVVDERPGTVRSVRGEGHDFVDDLVERMALPVILGLLTDEQYQALATYAVHRNQEAAASALGITFPQLNSRLNAARRRFAEAWVAPETPRRVGSRGTTAQQKADGVCRYGHPRAEHSFIEPSGRTRCRACRRISERRAARKRRQRAKAEAAVVEVA